MLKPDQNVVEFDLLENKRLGTEPTEVMRCRSSIQCSVACATRTWCVSANLSPDRSTCQLYSDEVSDATLLTSLDGWSYIRKLSDFTRPCLVF